MVTGGAEMSCNWDHKKSGGAVYFLALSFAFSLSNAIILWYNATSFLSTMRPIIASMSLSRSTSTIWRRISAVLNFPAWISDLAVSSVLATRSFKNCTK